MSNEKSEFFLLFIVWSVNSILSDVINSPVFSSLFCNQIKRIIIHLGQMAWCMMIWNFQQTTQKRSVRKLFSCSLAFVFDYYYSIAIYLLFWIFTSRIIIQTTMWNVNFLMYRIPLLLSFLNINAKKGKIGALFAVHICIFNFHCDSVIVIFFISFVAKYYV